MLKWTLRVGVALILLFVVAGVVLYFTLDGIVRGQVESNSAKSLNLGTKLDSANLGLLGGTLNLKGFRVDSPPGFSSDPILDLGGLDLKVAYGQLRKEPVQIESITIDRPKMLLEQANGQFNFKAMADRIPPSQPSDKPADPVRLIIGQIMVKEATVVLRPGIPGLQKEIVIPIETFTMQNIGSADGTQNGAAIKQVVTQLVTTLAAKATHSKDIPAQLKALLDGNLSEVAAKYIPGEAGKLVGTLLQGDILKDPTKVIGENANKLIGGATSQPADTAKGLMDNLLGGKKKEDKKK